MAEEFQYQWTDNPTVSGVSQCNTDVLNDCLMHLKYDKKDGGSGHQLFDVVYKDHVLEYGVDLKGFGQFGSYVYKDAIAGSRYGYPDIYAKCLEEREAAVTEEKHYVSSNVSLVGSVVDKNGVLSGFSTSNYATVPVALNPASGDAWEFVIEVTTGTNITSDQGVFTPIGSGNGAINLWCKSGFDFKVCDSASTEIASLPMLASATVANTTYKLKLTYSPTDGYKAYYKTSSDADFILGASNAATTVINTNVTHQFGTARTVDRPFYGTINLNETYFNINGERHWSGAELATIYRKSNRHAFYDISEKSKIDTIYNKNGMAWFYGVDTENERIFLPRNDYFFKSGSADEVGSKIKTQLPNIRGTGGYDNNTNESGSYWSGALKIQKTVSDQGSSGDNGVASPIFELDASLYDDTYTDGGTVVADGVNMIGYIVVGNTTTTTTNTVELSSESANAPITFDSETGAVSLSKNEEFTIDEDGNLALSGNTKVIDGQWVSTLITLSTVTATKMYTIDLSSHLPDDGHIYEVMLNQQGAYSSADTYAGVQVKSDIFNNFIVFGYPQANSRRVAGQVILPVGLSRSIVYQIYNNALGSNTGLVLMGYRRIGTNV